MKTSRIVTAAALCFLFSLSGPILCDAAATTSAIETIKTRPGVTQRLLVMKPDGPSGATLIMFPGGSGAGHFREASGGIKLSRNFLARSAEAFVRRGFLVAIVDVPSDQPSGMDDAFRRSDEHRQDIQKAIDHVAGRHGVHSIYLIGTSRGTISVLHLSSAINDPRIRGIAVTSGFCPSAGAEIGRVEQIRYPVLIVHHAYDGCKVTTFDGAVRLKGMLRSSPRVNFLEVRGGRLPASNPCEALSYHGFYGVEDAVVQAMSDWFSGKDIPDVIEKKGGLW